VRSAKNRLIIRRNTMPNRHKVNPGGFPKPKLTRGVAAAPNSIDKGEFLVRITPLSIMTKNARTANGARIRSAPIIVAIPLPPLKRRKMDQLCPAIAANPTIPAAHMGNSNT
jgi:hypothetical protein